jgi:hypothetical protein
MANEVEIINNPTSTPVAVSTGYQAQNIRANAGTNGIDNSGVVITDTNKITLKVSGGVDVNGTLYKVGLDTELTLSSFGRYFIHLAGTGSTLTPTLSTDDGTFDPDLNARYNASSERILNWIINYSDKSGLQIEKLILPDVGRNTFIEQDVQPETLITASGSWFAPVSKYYKFKLQARGGNGAGVSALAGTQIGGDGGGGAYGEVVLFLEAGTEVIFTFNTGSGALTQFVIGATTYSVENGSNGTANTGVSGSGGSSVANFDIGIPGETPGNVDITINTLRYAKGGNSQLGIGGRNRAAISTNGNGVAGSGYGSGGGGAMADTSTARTGGAGASGCCIIVG